MPQIFSQGVLACTSSELFPLAIALQPAAQFISHSNQHFESVNELKLIVQFYTNRTIPRRWIRTENSWTFRCSQPIQDFV